MMCFCVLVSLRAGGMVRHLKSRGHDSQVSMHCHPTLSRVSSKVLSLTAPHEFVYVCVVHAQFVRSSASQGSQGEGEGGSAPHVEDAAGQPALQGAALRAETDIASVRQATTTASVTPTVGGAQHGTAWGMSTLHTACVSQRRMRQRPCGYVSPVCFVAGRFLIPAPVSPAIPARVFFTKRFR